MEYLIINGAGASIDINKNFPDGERLLELLKKDYDLNGVIAKHNPSSIDHLMTKIIDQEQHKDLVKRVKAAISGIISGAQSNIKQWNNNYFFYLLQNSIGSIDKVDQVDVINFNYDTALEETVKYLIGVYEQENDGDAKRKQTRIDKLNDLLERLKNSHVYGYTGNSGDCINFIRAEKQERREEFIAKITKAKNIYFFGFGFDHTNLENLGLFDNNLMQLLRQNGKSIFVTNYVGEVEVKQYGGGISGGGRAVTTIDGRRFSNRIMITLEKIFDCRIQIIRDGFFSQGFPHVSGTYPLKLFISELSVGEAVKKDFVF